jgi:hypothetical protein
MVKDFSANWVLNSATSLLCRFVVATTGSCINLAIKEAWWNNSDINALENAEGLWDKLTPKTMNTQLGIVNCVTKSNLRRS